MHLILKVAAGRAAQPHGCGLADQGIHSSSGSDDDYERAVRRNIRLSGNG
jgi:hypothetical protein